jgi:hypothetical protein
MIGKREAEDAAAVESRLDPDPPAVPLDDATADRQPKAATALVTRVGGIDLLKAPEDDLQPISRDAAT